MSPIVIMKNKQVASLGEMNRLALKKIFDKLHFTRTEAALLEYSIAQWPKKTDLTQAERKELGVIVGALVENENGKFVDMQGEMIKHNLDYRKVYDVGL